MMLNPVDLILSLVLLSILFSFVSNRLPGLIKIVAFQGVAVSIIPFFIGHDMSVNQVLFTLSTTLIRGVVIPLSIYLAIRKIAIKREVQPIIGYHASIFFGLGLIVGATLVSRQLHIPSSLAYTLLFPTAIALPVTGMFLLMARRNAIAMVIGYIMMENGIYLVGSIFSLRVLHTVEFGILLDVLAGVMIMAIIFRNIKQTFDDVDTALLRTLKE